jgi:hypothetical protein
VALWLIVIGFYAAGCTFALFLNHTRAARRGRMEELLAGAGVEQLAGLQRLKALCSVAEIRQAETPWYERSLSTVGVVAFFSMLIATGVQTTRSGLETIKVEKLQQEKQDLEKQVAEIGELLSRTTSTVVKQYQITGYLDPIGEDTLRIRLAKLSASRSMDESQLQEAYTLALLLRDFKTAVQIIEDHLDLLDRTEPSHLVSLAEYYFLIGRLGSARDCLSRAEPKLSGQTNDVRKRAIVMAALLDTSRRQESVDRLAGLLKVQRLEAERRLDIEMTRFKRGAQRFLSP